MNIYRSIKISHSKFLNKLFGNLIISRAYWKNYQRFLNIVFGRKPNTLCNEELSASFDNSKINPDIKAFVTISDVNRFTLDADTINFLWTKLLKYRPQVILEFGSGVSTKLFIAYFKKHNNKKGTLISIDQDIEYLNKSSSEIDLGQIDHQKIYLPTNSTGYVLNSEVYNSLNKNGALIEFVLIDGPYGGWMVRENTLPLVVEFCKVNAVWFLDDSFRDSEMEVLRKWLRNKRIRLNGVANVGKGIGVGRVVG